MMMFDPGVQGLFDAVLDDRLVDERQHLLGLGLSGGQETGPQTRGGENGFANFRGRHRSYLDGWRAFWQLGVSGSDLHKPGVDVH